MTSNKLTRRWLAGLLVLLAPMALLFMAPLCAAPLGPPQTVRDYFLRLPDSYFEVPQAKREEAYFGHNGNNLTQVLDIKNDYLHAAGDGAQPPLTVALFRYQGTVTVAVLDGGYDPNIPTLDFLRYQNGRWRNVTESVLPLLFNSHLAYYLPQRGTTIRVCDSTGHTVYNLRWQGGRFHVR